MSYADHIRREVDENYTGLAKPEIDKDGNFSLVACKYDQVGIYGTCVKLKDGRSVAIGLGGFNEKLAFNEHAAGKHYSVIIEKIVTE